MGTLISDVVGGIYWLDISSARLSYRGGNASRACGELLERTFGA
jgi:hypothetical protein